MSEYWAVVRNDSGYVLPGTVCDTERGAKLCHAYLRSTDGLSPDTTVRRIEIMVVGTVEEKR